MAKSESLDESKLEPSVPVFRIEHMAHDVFVREDIADQILAQDFRRPFMTPLDEVDQ